MFILDVGATMCFYDKRSQSRRDKILHAALKLFTEKGYFKTSVHEIRERAGVSIGLLYRYFANKEAIATEIYNQLVDDMADTFERILTQDKPHQERALEVVVYYFGLAEKYPEVTDFVFNARHREIMHEEVSNCACSWNTRTSQIISAFLEEGMEAGAVRKMHPAVAQSLLFGSGIKLIQLQHEGGVELPLTNYIEEFAEGAWVAVKAPGEENGSFFCL